MRRFHSYGPVDADEHFCVPRVELVAGCAGQLVGMPGKRGHYFTIWAPRQTGKTWLMRQAIDAIGTQQGDGFLVGKMSMQGVFMEDDDPADAFLKRVPMLMDRAFGIDGLEIPANWEAFQQLFRESRGLFDRPVILLIDEFDNLPQGVIDRLAMLFRDIYLHRDEHVLHGLALIGVRAVLGVESRRGSPFNVQRSIHMPNLTGEEVTEMFDQYRAESGQTVADEVVDELYRVTLGQPGLVGWFGELLTEKNNPGSDKPLDRGVWQWVYEDALHVEPNNTVLNLLSKARGEHRDRVLTLFANPNVPFEFRSEWCNHLYMNGIIAPERVVDEGRPRTVCRFSTPFVQECIYNALTSDLIGDRTPILALEPLDNLADVFTDGGLDVPKLLDRYIAYLVRLDAAGIDPWQDQPRRKTDFQLRESVGHFHLYAWLKQAVGRRCSISPEFPTGNGKVDLHLRCREHRGLIEVKSFVDNYSLDQGRRQAADYARQAGLDTVTVALFMPVKDEAVLAAASGETRIDGVTVTVVAIGWL